MQRLRQWCEDINRVQADVEYDFVYETKRALRNTNPARLSSWLKGFGNTKRTYSQAAHESCRIRYRVPIIGDLRVQNIPPHDLSVKDPTVLSSSLISFPKEELNATYRAAGAILKERLGEIVKKSSGNGSRA